MANTYNITMLLALSHIVLILIHIPSLIYATTINENPTTNFQKNHLKSSENQIGLTDIAPKGKINVSPNSVQKDYGSDSNCVATSEDGGKTVASGFKLDNSFYHTGTDGDDCFWGAYDSESFDYGVNVRDVLSGGEGDDSLSGFGGNDEVQGNEGNDKIDGGSGNDNLQGNEGNDKIDGGSGNDSISGGYGVDILLGGNGNDSIYDDPGKDTIDCGPGIDTVFNLDINTEVINCEVFEDYVPVT